MREDTREIAELMDQAADLLEQNKPRATLFILVKIGKLLTQWVERRLSP